MKLYVSFTKMTFEEDGIEHNIIRGMNDKKFLTYDEVVKFSSNDKFIKDVIKITYKKDGDGKDTEEIESKIFLIKEHRTWNEFPLYEFKDGEIIPFDYTKYAYFARTRRRDMLAKRIHEIYNPPSEAKILRKTFKYIMDTLNIEYPDYFKTYDDKIEDFIGKNPKEEWSGKVS